jgi:hypothetical protein
MALHCDAGKLISQETLTIVSRHQDQDVWQVSLSEQGLSCEQLESLAAMTLLRCHVMLAYHNTGGSGVAAIGKDMTQQRMVLETDFRNSGAPVHIFF